jgi:polar amino acid transport system permease protein
VEPAQAVNPLNFHEIAPYFPDMLWGAWLTIRLSAISMGLGLAVAITGAYASRHAPRPLRILVAAYVEAIRNTPFLVQIFIIYFGFPAAGIRFEANVAAITAMVLNVSAYAIEIVRAGLDRISRGQIEAGRSLGLSGLQVFFLVSLPPAVQSVYPALTSQFILLLLGSSVVSTISANELTAVANDIQSRTFRTVETYLTAMAIYFVISAGFRGAFWAIEKLVFPPREYSVRADQ